LLDFSRETFHAEVAEVVLLGDSPDVPTARRSVPDDQCQCLDSVQSYLVRPVIDIATTGAQSSLVLPQPGGALAIRDGVEIGSALVASFGDESSVRCPAHCS
jgi:hypothetical protein